MRAVGNLYVQQEKARILREKANQAKLDTRKMAFDLKLYEKANTPSYAEEAARNKSLLTMRLMTTPQPAEIVRGDTLNAMLPLMREMSARGLSGRPIPLDQDLLKQVNLHAGTGSSSLGMLRNPSELDWPIVLQGSRQKKLAYLLPAAVYIAGDGKLTAKIYGQLTAELNDLSEELRRKFAKEEIDTGSFLLGKQFLDSLAQSIQGLSRPGARRMLDPRNDAKGKSVDELLEHMTSRGLLFAPSHPGGEASYHALHSAFVAHVGAAADASRLVEQGQARGPRFPAPTVQPGEMR